MYISPEELQRRHKQLRQALEQAYAQSPWNSRQIDRIADELTETERAMARLQMLASRLQPAAHAGLSVHAT